MSQESKRHPGFGSSGNTAEEFDNEVTAGIIETRLKRIREAFCDAGNSYTIYVVGMGAQRKSLFQEIENMDGASVVFHRSILPRIARVLSPIIASHSGLVRIDSVDALVPVFELLTNRSMAGIYFCAQERSTEFEASVRSHKPEDSYDYGIKADAGYFFYIVDADNAESRTGMFEVVSYGEKVPENLRF